MGKNNNNDSGTAISAAPKKHKFDPVILITLIIAVVILAGMITLLFYKNSDSYLRNQKAVTVGDVHIDGLEYTYYYQNSLSSFLNNYYSYISYLGLDFSKPLDQQQCAFDSSKTWAQYFEEAATNSVQQMVVLTEEAKKAGFNADEKVEENMNSTIDSMKEYAEEQDMTFEKYLEDYFGGLINEDNLKEILKKDIFASLYAEKIKEDVEVTDENVDEYYNENKKEFCNADYRYYTITFTTESTAETTEASDSTEATEATEPTEKYGDEEAKADADAFLNAITDEASFEQYARTLLTDEEKESKEDGFTLREDYACSSLSDDIAAWLLDESRQPGDKTVIKGTNSYTVLYYRNAYRDEYKLSNMRLVYIPVEYASDADDDAKAQAKEDAKAKAEEAYQKWQDGEKTEDAFAELAKEYSKESRASEGSLYEEIRKNFIDESVDEWLYNEPRTEGDTKLFETANGYFIIYFKSFGDTYWHATVVETLKTNGYTDWYNSAKESYPATPNEKVIEKLTER